MSFFPIVSLRSGILSDKNDFLVNGMYYDNNSSVIFEAIHANWPMV